MRYRIPGQIKVQELTERIRGEFCCPACKGEIDIRVLYGGNDEQGYVDFR